MCINGSANSSTMVRSSSISSPWVSISTCLPNWRERSRTRRAMRRKSGPDRHQAHRHGGLLQLRRDARQLRDLALEQRVLEGGQFLIVAHQRFGDHHFAGHIDQVIEFGGVDFDRHGLLAAARRGGGGRGRVCQSAHLPFAGRLGYRSGWSRRAYRTGSLLAHGLPRLPVAASPADSAAPGSALSRMIRASRASSRAGATEGS